MKWSKDSAFYVNHEFIFELWVLILYVSRESMCGSWVSGNDANCYVAMAENWYFFVVFACLQLELPYQINYCQESKRPCILFSKFNLVPVLLSVHPSLYISFLYFLFPGASYRIFLLYLLRPNYLPFLSWLHRKTT